MELKDGLLAQNSWRCEKCGQENSSSEKFCKGCGAGAEEEKKAEVTPSEETVSAEEKKPKKSKKKIFIWTAVIFFLLIGLGVGGYYAYDFQLKKKAGVYLVTQAEKFSQSVGAINALTTEKELDEEAFDDNLEILIKELEKEKEKVEEATGKTNEAKNSEAQQEDLKLIQSMRALLSGYYGELLNNLKEYQDYINYRLALSEVQKSYENNSEKALNSLGTVSSDEEFKNVIVSLREVINKAVSDLKNITPLEGLKDAHEKEVAFLEKYNTILGELVAGIETYDYAKVNQALVVLEAFWQNDETEKELRELRNYYFDELHKRFEVSRKQADKIKEEFLMSKGILQVEISAIEIESW